MVSLSFVYFCICKGYGGGTGRLDDFYSFDFRIQTWEEVKVVGDDRPGCRENNGVVISDSSNSIYLFGTCFWVVFSSFCIDRQSSSNIRTIIQGDTMARPG